MYKVSVCVSVHNTSQLLPRCLDSLIAQTLEDLEIVLVNNGSSDNSEEIMRDYQRRYPSRDIFIYCQNDKGLAQGRQTGVDNAHGEFITFLDADDYVVSQAYEKMYNAAISNKADIVEIQTMREGTIIGTSLSGLYDSKEILRKWFAGEVNSPTMLWLRLYKKNLFERPVLPLLYTNNEDNFAFPCLLYNSTKVFYLNEVLHEYTTDNENGYMKSLSSTDNQNKRYKAQLVQLKHVKHIEDYIGNKDIEDFLKEFNHYKAMVALVFVFRSFYGVSYSDKLHAASLAIGVPDNNLPQYIKKYGGYSNTIMRLIHVFGFKFTYFVHQRIIS